MSPLYTVRARHSIDCKTSFFSQKKPSSRHFVTLSPRAELIDFSNAYQEDPRVLDCTWSIAHDWQVSRPKLTGANHRLNSCASHRTLLCISFPPRIIACTCYVLAQRAVDGPHSASLGARISAFSIPSDASFS
ncbi:hypothetical protein C8R48DRAFT_792998 [Suillus tomentosus]|nr:hypothetical protein C8R48DRAFT_792998 [Suillus tomentosus]